MTINTHTAPVILGGDPGGVSSPAAAAHSGASTEAGARASGIYPPKPSNAEPKRKSFPYNHRTVEDVWRDERKAKWVRILSVIAAVRLAELDGARRDAMAPFERQLERVRLGAALITKPNFNRQPDITLGGIASGML